MTASLTDILTTAQSLVRSLNELGQTYLSTVGTKRSDALTNSTTLVTTGQGRLCRISVSATSGSTAGTVYDSPSSGSLVNAIATVPFALGSVEANVPFVNGLVVVVPPGVTAVVTYSGGA